MLYLWLPIEMFIYINSQILYVIFLFNTSDTLGSYIPGYTLDVKFKPQTSFVALFRGLRFLQG